MSCVDKRTDSAHLAFRIHSGLRLRNVHPQLGGRNEVPALLASTLVLTRVRAPAGKAREQSRGAKVVTYLD